ncbi:AMP-dependent synthetase/ligase [Aureispira anguillae]|uniref:Long-chain fatty acid--CoA ligase n=1 Tax=Aureispira anguillae TaxID=2864201 RepID=A0A915YKP7_9BACT|nr:long-chain fatty acid--CoA ligase [Aureispira anguillae]BDS15005.1 long-chain fatty acid--CoA ligase [Aureispira anguillae]
MNPTRLFEIPYYQLSQGALAASIGGKHIKGHNYSYSTEEFIKLANQVSLGLLQMGVKPGDKIALISHNNRPEWNIMDIGMAQIGVINVPVYPTISPKDYVYIFNDATIKYCFLGHGDLLDKVRKAQPDVPSLQGIFTFDEVKGETDHNGNEVHHWETILTEGDLTPVEKIKATIKPDDLATLIYTSGTTGNPKGVMLSHTNILSNIKAVGPLVPVAKGDVALSFLPLCHVFERVVTYAYMYLGVSIVYAQSIDTLGESLKEVRPHFFTTVPRLLEKVYEKIVTKAREGSGLKQKIFFWAEGLTAQYAYDFEPSGFNSIKWKLADKIVFSKVRDNLGGRVKGILTGAAACPRKMAQFFSAIGIPVREGYGMTETSPAIAVSGYRPKLALLGTVGPVIDKVTVRIDVDEDAYGPDAGEITVKGPNVMLGYYNKPEKTAEEFSEDGWFLTGDVGKLIKKDGVEFLKITDRKKELLKTSGGKYVAPAPIEGKFREDFLVEQVMVIGNNKKFVSALILPAFDTLEQWCKRNDVNTTSRAAMIQDKKVCQYYENLIKQLNPNFAKVEQIKKFKLVDGPWDVDSGHLTPTMKLKRRVILEEYNDLIEDIYKV